MSYTTCVGQQLHLALDYHIGTPMTGWLGYKVKKLYSLALTALTYLPLECRPGNHNVLDVLDHSPALQVANRLAHLNTGQHIGSACAHTFSAHRRARKSLPFSYPLSATLPTDGTVYVAEQASCNWKWQFSTTSPWVQRFNHSHESQTVCYVHDLQDRPHEFQNE